MQINARSITAVVLLLIDPVKRKKIQATMILYYKSLHELYSW